MISEKINIDEIYEYVKKAQNVVSLEDAVTSPDKCCLENQLIHRYENDLTLSFGKLDVKALTSSCTGTPSVP